jgi:hypothetical protein
VNVDHVADLAVEPVLLGGVAPACPERIADAVPEKFADVLAARAYNPPPEQ